jgi:phosphoribosyl-AMP cyclohydrolase
LRIIHKDAVATRAATVTTVPAAAHLAPLLAIPPWSHAPQAPENDAMNAQVRFGPDGLVPAVAQQWDTGEVLMLAWMDDEALRRTLQTGRATYWSRSRQQYWVKGETSGHTQAVKEVRIDCDGDAILVLVDQNGPACHTGLRSCFDTATLEA